MTNEKEIWAWFKSHTPFNDYAIAGIMGNIQAESAGLPNNVENRCPYSDDEYTRQVDSGERSPSLWASDAYGYGLFQWTFHTRKTALLNFAKSKGVSIADMGMQLEFFMKELQSDYRTVYNRLYTAANLLGPTSSMCEDFERPANATAQTQVRYGYAQEIYERNHSDTPTATTNSNTELVNKLCDIITLLKEIVENL